MVIHTAIKVLKESSIRYMPLRDWIISENCYICWMWWVDGAFLIATVATWTVLQNTHRPGSGWLPNQHFLRAVVSDCNVSIHQIRVNVTPWVSMLQQDYEHSCLQPQHHYVHLHCSCKTVTMVIKWYSAVSNKKSKFCFFINDGHL